MFLLFTDPINAGIAFALSWGPNGLFLAAYESGSLQLPRALKPVHRLEPLLYRRLGVGVVKKVVATRTWPLMLGFEPPAKPKGYSGLLDQTERAARGSEVCHAATFLLCLAAAGFCAAVGRSTTALWILAFNLLLNGYPVMLQRSHRWRIQKIRAKRIAG